MKTKILQIGTSVGIIIPRFIANEERLSKGSLVNIEYKDGKIIISKIHTPRTGWKEAFAKYAKEIKTKLHNRNIDG